MMSRSGLRSWEEFAGVTTAGPSNKCASDDSSATISDQKEPN